MKNIEVSHTVGNISYIYIYTLYNNNMGTRWWLIMIKIFHTFRTTFLILIFIVLGSNLLICLFDMTYLEKQDSRFVEKQPERFTWMRLVRKSLSMHMFYTAVGVSKCLHFIFAKHKNQTKAVHINSKPIFTISVSMWPFFIIFFTSRKNRQHREIEREGKKTISELLGRLCKTNLKWTREREREEGRWKRKNGKSEQRQLLSLKYDDK